MRRNSARKGAKIGFGIGVGLGLGALVISDSSARWHLDRALVTGAIAGLYAGIGAAVGALNHKLVVVYQR